jgi:acetylglutamate kinase
LGAVGKVSKVNAAPLDLLTQAGYLPTIACVAGGAEGAIFNVNADQMAAACAGGFKADRMIYLTDVAGVLNGEHKLIRSLTIATALRLIEDGVARGGMEAKLRAAISSIEDGAERVRVAAGAEPDVIARLLAGESLGTEIVAE